MWHWANSLTHGSCFSTTCNSFSCHIVKYNSLKQQKQQHLLECCWTNKIQPAFQRPELLVLRLVKRHLLCLLTSNCTQEQFWIFTQGLGQWIQFLACQTKCHWLDQTLLVSQSGQRQNTAHCHYNATPLSHLSVRFTTIQVFSVPVSLCFWCKRKENIDLKKLANTELNYEAWVWVQGLPLPTQPEEKIRDAACVKAA